jgi:hypothetical protein
MVKNKNIEPRNHNDELHGYQEWYGLELWVRVVYKHGFEIGYEENHGINLYGYVTTFYIK